jgi:hypothetical protein
MVRFKSPASLTSGEGIPLPGRREPGWASEPVGCSGEKKEKLDPARTRISTVQTEVQSLYRVDNIWKWMLCGMQMTCQHTALPPPPPPPLRVLFISISVLQGGQPRKLLHCGILQAWRSFCCLLLFTAVLPARPEGEEILR